MVNIFNAFGGTSIVGSGNIGDAVRLWDGVTPSNTTQLSSANTTPDSSVLAPAGLISFWLKQPSGNFRITTQQSAGDERGIVFQFSGNNGYILANDTSGNPLLQAFPNTLYSYSSDWKHFLITYQFLNGNSFVKITVNDSPRYSTTSNAAYNLFQRTPFALNYQGASPAELYDFFHIADGGYDAYDVAVRRKFIDASGKPVDLGSRGQKPFGTVPRLFFGGAFNNWKKNKGGLLLVSNNELQASANANFTKSPDKPS